MKKKKLLSVICAMSMMASPQIMTAYAAGNVSEPAAVSAAEQTAEYTEATVDGGAATTITANAENTADTWYTFDESTGKLTLKGDVDKLVLSGLSEQKKEAVKSIFAEPGTVFPSISSYMFMDYKNCETIDLSNVDTSNVVHMSGMFFGCKHLRSVDLSSFDTSKVEDMEQMFAECYRLESLDLSSFDTSNVSTMFEMFFQCCSLKSLDLSNFNTSKVSTMSNMFGQCESLDSLDLSSFDTSNVERMNSMFSACSNLTSIDVSSFNTSKVNSIRGMFEECVRLTSLDLSNIDISSASLKSSILGSCYSLKELTLGDSFTEVKETLYLPNAEGWANKKSPSTIISGSDEQADFTNSGVNTYIRKGDIELPLQYTGDLHMPDEKRPPFPLVTTTAAATTTATTTTTKAAATLATIANSNGTDSATTAAATTTATKAAATLATIANGNDTDSATTAAATTTAATVEQTTTTSAAASVKSDFRFGLPRDEIEYLPGEDGEMLYIWANNSTVVSGPEELSSTTNPDKYSEVRECCLEAFKEAVESIKGTYSDCNLIRRPLAEETMRIYKEKGYEEKTGYKVEDMLVHEVRISPKSPVSGTTATTVLPTTASTTTTVTTTAPKPSISITVTPSEISTIKNERLAGTYGIYFYNCSLKDVEYKYTFDDPDVKIIRNAPVYNDNVIKPYVAVERNDADFSNYTIIITKATDINGNDMLPYFPQTEIVVKNNTQVKDTTTTGTVTTSVTTTTTTASTTTTAATTTTPVSGTNAMGDIDGNSTIDGRDASAVLAAYAKSSSSATGDTGLTTAQEKAGDVTEDGSLDGRDASAILTYYTMLSAGKTVSLSDFSVKNN
ncbi:MAG: BspA family leucine-rich repeat surface protein [Ruminococcus sp.]|nr:BspA family leucine-rich repeat surface protein [Ruminococcus sp.]